MKIVFSLLSLFICFGSVNFVHSQIPEEGLILYLPFNGNANDRSGNCLLPDFSNAQLTSDRFGIPYSAYHFNGTINQFFSYSTPNFNLGEFSYSLWALAEDFPVSGDFKDMISIGGDEYQDHCLAIRNDGWGSTSYNADGNAQILYSTEKTNLNQWTHLVLTRSIDRIKLYHNGKLVDNQLITNLITPFYSTNLITTIGMRHNSTHPFKGKIDDVRIYNKELTTTEINELYNENVCRVNLSVTDTLFINANITSYNPILFDINLKAYPNPTLDHLIIEINDLSKVNGYSFNITNSSGIEVYQTFINQNIYNLDMNTWKGKGLYLLYLYDKNGSIVDVKKIVLQ